MSACGALAELVDFLYPFYGAAVMEHGEKNIKRCCGENLFFDEMWLAFQYGVEVGRNWLRGLLNEHEFPLLFFCDEPLFFEPVDACIESFLCNVSVFFFVYFFVEIFYRHGVVCGLEDGEV